MDELRAWMREAREAMPPLPPGVPVVVVTPDGPVACHTAEDLDAAYATLPRSDA